MDATRRVAVSAFRIERRKLETLFVLRCSIGVAVSLVAGWVAGQPFFAVAGAMGAMSTGFASLQGVYRTRAATMLTMAVAMALSTVVGMVTAHSPWMSIAALAIWGYCFGVGASLGAPAAAVGVNAILALIVFNHFSASGTTMWLTAACVVGGGLVQTLLLVVLWPIQRYPLERAALANAYRALATYARALDHDRPMLPPVAPLQNVRATLADPRPFGRNAALAAFSTLLSEGERIRATLGRLTARGGASYEGVRATVAQTLDTIADALDLANAPNDPQIEARLKEPHDDALLRMLFGQLRAAWRGAGVPLRGVSIGRPRALSQFFPDLDESLATLRANLWIDSSFGRHAFRLGIVLALCTAIADFSGWQRGYWMTLTAALILRPDFTTTLARGIARIAGTLAGVALATVLVVLIPDTPYVSLALVIFFAACGYATFQLNYALYSLTVTSYVVFLIALLGAPEEAALVNRLLATVAGGTLAMLSYMLWPTWESPHTRERIVELLDIDRLYTRALFAGLIDPAQRDLRALNALRQQVWSARSAAQESLERMLSEPEQSHETDADLAVALMAAIARIGLANLSLASLFADKEAPAFPEAEPLARAFESSFASLHATFGQRTPPVGAQTLRDAQVALAQTIPSDRYGRSTLVASTDLLVDGVNTVGDLLTSTS